jgi:hypothetical protein
MLLTPSICRLQSCITREDPYAKTLYCLSVTHQFGHDCDALGWSQVPSNGHRILCE